MFAFSAHLLTPTLLMAVIPSILSLPYPIYGVKSYRRSVPVKNEMSYYQPSSQYDDQSSYISSGSHSPPSVPQHQQQYYSNDDNNYYLNGGTGYRDSQYQLYGKPTYSGEYKPKQYYFGRGPKYNYFDDRLENSNPLDYLHEEMFQEEQRDRQNNWPSGMEQWFQNNGQPRSLTNEFIKNLMLYNGKPAPEPEYEREADHEFDTGLNDYDDEDLYYGNEPSQNYESYDRKPQLTPAKDLYQQQIASKLYDLKPAPKTSVNQNDDMDEFELKSLRKQFPKDDASNDDDFQSKHTNTHKNAAYNGYDSGFDYDDDAWINWDRKRSGTNMNSKNNGFSPLKALEMQLMSAIKNQRGTKENQHVKTKSTMTSTEPTTTSTTTVDTELDLIKLKTMKGGGQKEIVLQQPAAPIRRAGFDPSIAEFIKGGNHRTAKDVSKFDISFPFFFSILFPIHNR